MMTVGPIPVSTPRQVLAPLQKVTPRQQAVADQLGKQMSPLTTAILDDGGDVVPLQNPIEEDVLMNSMADAGGVPSCTVFSEGARAVAAAAASCVAQADSNNVDLPPVTNLPVAHGTIIGDEKHLFWRKGLEVHVRVWELSDPACYAAQLHTTTPRKKPLGILYMDKQSVDESLDASYVLNGSARMHRATIDASDLQGKKAELIVSAADAGRVKRHRKSVMTLVVNNMNIQGNDRSSYSVALAEKGGKPSPFMLDAVDDIAGKVTLQPRKFETGKLSRADIIKNFQRVSADFNAQLENVKHSTGHSAAAARNSGMILESTADMTSPSRMHSVLKGIKLRTAVKLKALNAFKIPRKTL